MTGNVSLLNCFKSEDGPEVVFGYNNTGKIRGYGTISNGSVIIAGVAFVEGLKHNLLSVSQFCDKGHNVTFHNNQCLVRESNTNLVKLIGSRKGNTYITNLEHKGSNEMMCFQANSFDSKTRLWHRRFCHLNFKNISKLISKDSVIGLPKLSFENNKFCNACQLGKLTKVSFKSKISNYESRPLYLLHMDLFGPMSVTSLGGRKYTLVVIDDYSRFTWVFFLKAKNDTPSVLISFMKQIQNEFDKVIAGIRSDHGTEFDCLPIEEFCEKHGIFHNFSAPRTPQQNGIAERRNRTLIEAERKMLNEMKLPQYFLGRSSKYCMLYPKQIFI